MSIIPQGQVKWMDKKTEIRVTRRIEVKRSERKAPTSGSKVVRERSARIVKEKIQSRTRMRGNYSSCAISAAIKSELVISIAISDDIDEPDMIEPTELAVGLHGSTPLVQLNAVQARDVLELATPG
jgi:hypothetical protein